MPQEMREAPLQNRSIAARPERKFEPILKVIDRKRHAVSGTRSAWQRLSLWALIRRMRGARRILSLVVCSLLPLGCGSSGTKSEWPKGNIVLKDANNYTSNTNLDNLPQITTKAGADLMVCWDGLMKDLLCHPIAQPNNGIDNVGFLQIKNVTQKQVRDKLAVGQLDPNLVTTYREFHTNGTATCANLSQFALGTVLDPATDYVEPAAGQTITYMLLFATGTTPGVGSKAMVFLNPSSSSDVTTVSAPDACANNVLTFSATLGAPMNIPATDNTKWHIDWSQVTHDSFNNKLDFETLKIDYVLVGFYQGMQPADLQAGFKDIELTATSMYRVDVADGARDVDLVNAKSVADGTTAFPGFTQTGGTWAIAVRCSKCQVPAPIVMTILQPQ